MPYDQLEEIGARRHEKVALYLTFENAVGLIAGALPAYVALASAPGLLRIVLTVLGGIVGVIMTLDVAGMPISARLLWRVRGVIRLRTRSTLITPADLAGTPLPVSTGHARALRVGGSIQLAQGPALPAYGPTLRHPRVACDLPLADGAGRPTHASRPQADTTALAQATYGTTLVTANVVGPCHDEVPR